jgi:hypothetical protein
MYFINHEDLGRFISFCDYRSGNFYDSLFGMVPLMTGEGEIGTKSSAPGDSRAGGFLCPLY